MRTPIWLIAVATVTAGCAGAAPRHVAPRTAAPTAAAAQATTRVAGTAVSVGFDIANDLATATPWNDISEDNLFALQTTAGSALDTSGQGMSLVNVAQWVANAHAHHRLAMMTIGGIADQNWQTACNATYRRPFITNLVNYMRSNGFDGMDLDIEDDAWAAMVPPVAPWDACVQAISNAARATTTTAGRVPLISADVTTNWMGSYYAKDVAYIDQFNLMTYGDTCIRGCSSFSSDVTRTHEQGLPKDKMVLGIDLIDRTPQHSDPSGADCGEIASYARQQGLMGTMVWDMHQDGVLHNGSTPCLDQIASHLGLSPARTR